jgi:hypothetical protein
MTLRGIIAAIAAVAAITDLADETRRPHAAGSVRAQHAQVTSGAEWGRYAVTDLEEAWREAVACACSDAVQQVVEQLHSHVITNAQAHARMRIIRDLTL